VIRGRGPGGQGDAVTLRGRHVLPVASEPLAGGWVRVASGRIVEVGGGSPPPPVVDLGDAIVLPGLVNAHTHLEFSDLAAPLPAGGGLPGWIERVIGLRRGRDAAGSDETTRAVAIAAGLAESARAGVTAIGEISTGALLPGDRGGPRVRSFREALGLNPGAMTAARVAMIRDLDAGRHPPGHAGISPHAPYSVGQPLGRQLVDEAVRRGLPLAMHLAESPEELELLATRGGPFRGLLERLGAWLGAGPRFLSLEDWISLLARAPRAIVVHGTFLPEVSPALARLARHRDRLCVVVPWRRSARRAPWSSARPTFRSSAGTSRATTTSMACAGTPGTLSAPQADRRVARGPPWPPA